MWENQKKENQVDFERERERERENQKTENCKKQ